MATLAATAAPKLSEMSEGTKAEKSRNEIDKIIKQAGQFYQDMADTQGRGRFPNQTKFNSPVGPDYSNAGGSSTATATAIANSAAHNDNVMRDLGLYDQGNDADGNDLGTTDGWQNYSDTPVNQWVSVFGGYEGSNSKITQAGTDNEWLALFGDEVLGSTFQDGHYVYTVVAGGGTGNDVYPPVVYVVDIENAVDFNNVLEP